MVEQTQVKPHPRVLVADDDGDICYLVKHQLTRIGCEVIEARDGQEALKLAYEQGPDVAMLDIMMPRLNGYDVAKELRAHRDTENIEVIMVSARVQDVDVVRGFEAGADDYVKKPFAPQEIAESVEAAIARAQRRSMSLK